MSVKLNDGPMLITVLRKRLSDSKWSCVDNNQQCKFFKITPAGFFCKTQTIKGNPIPTLFEEERPLKFSVPDYQCPYRPYSE